ncbi:putative domain HDIG-containing protein [Sphaerochaeta pleomorpha str. Grapes]|uniref:Putative domain HDIG-containing protein n=1 Tax=Sphaerochaeta pleomorpha (strain ATCC BAA-1885 / DSM 22778 / Grapes) TaxID=158190 RepID=G8QRN4_SPHPG|nr:HD domain-containing protein [Sphaerochaeta pleomorpha]AEV28817.1 putative domain HDIG-containing protein [Sphaerochaeta pleomorpha str. Grapes]
METVEKILAHPQFWAYLELNAEAEKDRVYCKHDYQHALDVARVAYCIVLERHLSIDKDLLYATALLHDIAKWKQYALGSDHAEEGAVLAGQILSDIGLDKDTTASILCAIRTHRAKDGEKSLLGEVLYESDKACRPCISCKSLKGCKRFPDGKKPALQY